VSQPSPFFCTRDGSSAWNLGRQLQPAAAGAIIGSRGSSAEVRGRAWEHWRKPRVCGLRPHILSRNASAVSKRPLNAIGHFYRIWGGRRGFSLGWAQTDSVCVIGAFWCATHLLRSWTAGSSQLPPEVSFMRISGGTVPFSASRSFGFLASSESAV